MRRTFTRGLVVITLSAALSVWAHAFEIKKADAPPALSLLAMHIGGRTVAEKAVAGRVEYKFQWPGVYFESAFTGSALYFETGAGRAIYRVIVDGEPEVKWLNPGPGTYRLEGLPDGAHTIRLELVTECQGGPVEFGGFAITSGEKAGTSRVPAREIEFIGDSHTVGYGNTSSKRQCTSDEIWSTTDTSLAFGPRVAQHFGADYQINAISGRGIVRNYGGFAADTLPQAYPFALFDHQQPVSRGGWNPQVVVIGLGTNDFSTPLKPAEKWKTRDELHADFERSYVRFVQQLRATHPRAFFLLAANDSAEGEIQAEVRKVIAQLTADGEGRVAFIPFNALELTACDWHPSLADHQKMAALVTDFIERHPELW